MDIDIKHAEDALRAYKDSVYSALHCSTPYSRGVCNSLARNYIRLALYSYAVGSDKDIVFNHFKQSAYWYSESFIDAPRIEEIPIDKEGWPHFDCSLVSATPALEGICICWIAGEYELAERIINSFYPKSKSSRLLYYESNCDLVICNMLKGVDSITKPECDIYGLFQLRMLSAIFDRKSGDCIRCINEMLDNHESFSKKELSAKTPELFICLRALAWTSYACKNQVITYEDLPIGRAYFPVELIRMPLSIGMPG